MLSSTLLLLLFGSHLSLATFSSALDSLRSHRIMERLQALAGWFFYLRLHRRIMGSGLAPLKLCLKICSLLTHYAWVLGFLLRLIGDREAGRLELSFFSFLPAIALLLASDALPRLCALRWPHNCLRWSSLPVSILCSAMLWLTWPLTRLMERTALSAIEQNPTAELREKMMEMLHDFDSAGVVDWQNRSLLHGIIKYQDRVVREIMVPRVEIFCLSASTSINEAAALILREGYTRIPVFRDQIDQILGVIMAKDLLKVYLEAQEHPERLLGSQMSIAPLVKPVLFTPDNKRISALLQEFRKRHLHLAIVVDEYGGTEGLVTIEDILEEIVGDIEDEYDLSKKPFTLLSDGSYLIDAHMSILDLNESIGLQIPTHDDYDTLSGYIFSKLGSIPSMGLVIHQNEFDLEVIDCNERSVEKVKLRIHPSSS